MLLAPDSQATSLAAESFLRQHKDELLARLPLDEVSSGVSVLTYVFTRACDPARRGAIADYISHAFASLPGAARPVTQAIEAMDQCIASRQVLEPQIRAWLGGLAIR